MPRRRKGNNSSPGGDEAVRPRREFSLNVEQDSGPHSRVAELQLQIELAKVQLELAKVQADKRRRERERQMWGLQTQRPTSTTTSLCYDWNGWGPERQFAYCQGIVKPLVPMTETQGTRNCSIDNSELVQKTEANEVPMCESSKDSCTLSEVQNSSQTVQDNVDTVMPNLEADKDVDYSKMDVDETVPSCSENKAAEQKVVMEAETVSEMQSVIAASAKEANLAEVQATTESKHCVKACGNSEASDAAGVKDGPEEDLIGVVVNDDGKTRSAGIVEVKARPKEKSDILRELSPVTLNAGEKGKLEAKVAGQPKSIVEWLENGQELSPSDCVRMTEESDGRVALVLDKVAPEDGGKYTVVPANDNGENRSSAAVSVNQPPLVAEPMKDVDAVEELPAKLEAKVSGEPMPEMILPCPLKEGACHPSLDRYRLVPPGVRKQYDPGILMKGIGDALAGWDQSASESVIPRNSVEFSYWLAANLPLDDSRRLNSLVFERCIQRLRYELSTLQKYTTLCGKECSSPIADRYRVFSISREVPLSTDGHDSITLYEARGSNVVGLPSTGHSWFPGYAWTMTQCRERRNHMGWMYTAECPREQRRAERCRSLRANLNGVKLRPRRTEVPVWAGGVGSART